MKLRPTDRAERIASAKISGATVQSSTGCPVAAFTSPVPAEIPPPTTVAATAPKRAIAQKYNVDVTRIKRLPRKRRAQGQITPVTDLSVIRVRRRKILHGLINEYQQVA